MKSDEEITSFIKGYSEKFLAYSLEYFGKYFDRYQSDIDNTISNRDSTLFVFGNGGSHAIARCIRHSYQSNERFSQKKCRIITEVNVDNYSSLSTTPGPPFSTFLEAYGVRTNDRIVLISGSGESENLIEVANLAAKKNISLMALVGARGSTLEKIIGPNDLLSVGLDDQQISEDVIQFFACIASRGKIGSAELQRLVMDQAQHISSIPSKIVNQISTSISTAFLSKKRVRIIGVGCPLLAACAEHIAHNLNWDAFYELGVNPDVQILSSPTACDYSGISNDRRKQYLKHFSKTYELSDKEVSLVFSRDNPSQSLAELFERENPASPVHIVYKENDAGDSFDLPMNYYPVSASELSFPHLVQSLGHILGRVLRFSLLQATSEDHQVIPQSKSVSEFLIEGDLAQRRLIDE